MSNPFFGGEPEISAARLEAAQLAVATAHTDADKLRDELQATKADLAALRELMRRFGELDIAYDEVRKTLKSNPVLESKRSTALWDVFARAREIAQQDQETAK